MRIVPSHTRRTKRGIVTVRSYTSQTAMASLSATDLVRSRSTFSKPPVMKNALSKVKREISHRASLGRERARAIQSYRKEIVTKF